MSSVSIIHFPPQTPKEARSIIFLTARLIGLSEDHQQVVNRFPIPLAHATYVHHNDVPPPEIIQGEDLS
jgi:hypothetical protein